MKILVTGAAGWVARHLVNRLESQHELVLVDRVDPEQATIFVPGQAERKAAPLQTRWPYFKMGITDLEKMTQACRGVDAVIHLAASTTGLPEHGPSVMEANVVGTYVVHDAARLSGVRRVLSASSINALGTIYWRISGRPVAYHRLPLDENYPPEPEDPYSLSKWCGELTSDSFHRAYGLETASFRFAALWSDEQYRAACGKLPSTEVWSDDLYSWVHVEDVITGLCQALTCPVLGAGTYFLSAGDTRCPEPTQELLHRFKPKLALQLALSIPGRAPLVSIDKAQASFGYKPLYRLQS